VIYLIGDGKYVKIGYTSGDVSKRLSNLQVGSVAELTVLSQFPGERDDEARLHAEFSDRRVAGEWFILTPDEVAGITSRELGGSAVERTFTESGMILVVRNAVARRLREMGFPLLTTVKEHETTIRVDSEITVVSYCPEARDEVVEDFASLVPAKGFPTGTRVAVHGTADKTVGGARALGFWVVASHPTYDLDFGRHDRAWIEYERVPAIRIAIMETKAKAEEAKKKAERAARAKNLWDRLHQSPASSGAFACPPRIRPYVDLEDQKLLKEHGYDYQKPDEVDF
jgi:hypothetical protein